MLKSYFLNIIYRIPGNFQWYAHTRRNIGGTKCEPDAVYRSVSVPV